MIKPKTVRSRFVHPWSMMVIVALVVGISGALPPQTARAATIGVTTTADELNTDGDCSLREAIRAANLNVAVDACTAGGALDSIDVPAGTYVLTISPPGADDDASANGDLDLTDSVNINGAGVGATIIDGNNDFGVFEVLGTGVSRLSNLTIRRGDNSGVFVNENASAVLVATMLDDNFNFSNGGGIFNQGFVQVIRSTISNNDGGPRGGGIRSFGSIEIIDSTISGNTATSGGGILNNGTLRLTNTTISGNTATRGGGGILNTGLLYINASTITANQANASRAFEVDAVGGGIKNDGGSVFFWNTILAENTDNRSEVSPAAAPDCFGTLQSERNNIVGIRNPATCTITGPFVDDSEIGTPVSPIDPRLLPLSDNGGPTRTHALLSTSPAIDEGSTFAPGSDIFACPVRDQRGGARPQDGDSDGTAVCDIGAYEAGAELGRGELTSVEAVCDFDEYRPDDEIRATIRFTISESFLTLDAISAELDGATGEVVTFAPDYAGTTLSPGSYTTVATIRDYSVLPGVTFLRVTVTATFDGIEQTRSSVYFPVCGPRSGEEPGALDHQLQMPMIIK